MIISRTLLLLCLSSIPVATSFNLAPTRLLTRTTRIQKEHQQHNAEHPLTRKNNNFLLSATISNDEAVVEEEKTTNKKRPNLLVVGAGWGGWGAAKALCESGVDADITIMDALPDPSTGQKYLSETGKPVEAGTRGFWKDYPNINDLCAELGLKENDVFTPYTNSSFYSPDGLEATAPVFSEATADFAKNIPFLSNILEQQLPSPLGQVIATFPLFERIPLEDRASMVGLLVATIDCLGGDETVKEQYDRMTAHELFLKFRLSKRLVDDFIRPTLLVGLFKPPEELSALVTMELLYYYALAHQDSFDVRWIKSGTVTDSLVEPLAKKLKNDYSDKFTIMAGTRATKISLEGDGSTAATVEYQSGKDTKIMHVDGIILALACRGMEGIVNNSPDLARMPVFANAATQKGIDVISVRLWFDRVIPTRTPANVFSRFDELRGAGGTFFMLDQFQEDNLDLLWGEEEGTVKDYGSVVACDFYNAGNFLGLPNEDIIKTLVKDLLPSAVPAFADAELVDSWVGKYPGSVTWFSPGSYTKRPTLEIPETPYIKCAGDWVRMGDREHGAKGLCQERAYVSGIEAGNALLRDVVDTTNNDYANNDNKSRKHPVIPVRDDELQYKAAVAVNNKVMEFLPRFWVR